MLQDLSRQTRSENDRGAGAKREQSTADIDTIVDRWRPCAESAIFRLEFRPGKDHDDASISHCAYFTSGIIERLDRDCGRWSSDELGQSVQFSFRRG